MLTVGSYGRLIQQSLGSVGPARVRGVISPRVFTASSGHKYFTLQSDQKGEDARVECVLFASRRSQVVVTAGHTAIVSLGRVNFWAPNGKCSAIADQVTLVDEPEDPKVEVRIALAAELDRPRKALPLIPQHIVVITSSGSAAEEDICEGILSRSPQQRVTFVHSSVQGSAAPSELAAAFRRGLRLRPPPDVIICGRGGGSAADLATFDTEVVARCFACEVPTVSAVGHQTDWSVCDEVADVTVKTPTEAAHRVIPETLAERLVKLRGLERSLALVWRKGNALRRRKLDTLERCLGWNLRKAMRTSESRISKRAFHMRSHCEAAICRCKKRLEALYWQASAHDPQNVLKRGYAYVSTSPQDTPDTPVSQVRYAEAGAPLRLVFQDWEVEVVVRCKRARKQ